MKIRNPKSRFDLSIKKGDNVLDIGGGHNPHPRANVIVDKYADDNSHRSGDIKRLKHQKFIEADGQSLPFGDKEFDYVTCHHVLEHVDDPIEFLSEISRVGKKGYIETPSLIGEYLHPKASHKWLVLEIDEQLVLYDKEVIGFNTFCNFGNLFLSYLQSTSLGYKIMDRTYPQIREVHWEWVDEVTCLVNPPDEAYKDYFTKPWDDKMIQTMFPKKSLQKEVMTSSGALMDIVKTYFS